jgi:NAD(P)H-flavin reductase
VRSPLVAPQFAIVLGDDLHRSHIMDYSLFQRRGPAGMDLTPTLTFDARQNDPNVVVKIGDPNSTIAPYHQGLNGIDPIRNNLFVLIIWWCMGAVGFIILAIRIIELLWSKLRQVSAMSVPRDKQMYWRTSQWRWMPGVKKHILYAPLGSKRHNREIRLSSALNYGTIPSRFHTLLLVLWGISNIVYTVYLRYGVANKYEIWGELRGRTGVMAVINMVPLIIFSARNNPLIPMLQISFDTFNLFHRWLGRIVVIETVLHLISWAVVAAEDQGIAYLGRVIVTNPFLSSGWIGTLALSLIFILSLSPIRHAFYETFLASHIALAMISFVCTLVHCITASVGVLPYTDWLIAIFVLWFLERFARIFRLAYFNWSKKGFTDAVLEPMPGETTRVTLRLPNHHKIKPGTHAYLRFWGVRAWETHPFSIAWVQYKSRSDLPSNEKEKEKEGEITAVVDKSNLMTEVSFLIGAHTGVTRHLYNKAISAGQPSVTIKASFEGPYAGHHDLHSYGHAVLFAGATGITHQISYLRPILEGYTEGRSAIRRLTLVWVVREYEALEWVRPWMDAILRIPNRKDVLRIQVFVTRPTNPRDIVSASSTVKMFPGRPDIPLLLAKEVQEQTGAMAVTVCGPGAMADDVRGAVRGCQGDTVIDFIEESFTW